ncbi:MAG: CGNR zinc finger domain-containing protein [Acidobacteria bacterium]|nr:CGNR zinc finger domain-containing protein [Acidobacteriota bacterium]
MFLDRSKRGNRRWCDMTVCGNRAKARRFYLRKKNPGDRRPATVS